MSSWVSIGKITRPHGLQGAVVVSGIQSPSIFSLPQLEVRIGTSLPTSVQHTIVEANWMPKGWKLSLKQIETFEAAMGLKNQLVFCPRTHLEIQQNEYLVSDLIGSRALDAETGKDLGVFVRAQPQSSSEDFETVDRWWFRSETGNFAVPATLQFVAKVDGTLKQIWLRQYHAFL